MLMCDGSEGEVEITSGGDVIFTLLVEGEDAGETWPLRRFYPKRPRYVRAGSEDLLSGLPTAEHFGVHPGRPLWPRVGVGGFGGSPPDNPLACPLPPLTSRSFAGTWRTCRTIARRASATRGT
jgi:hypothetical protein